MSKNGYSLRVADETDCLTLLNLIYEFSEYIGPVEELTVTFDKLRQSMFVEKRAEAILALHGEEAVGYALYFPTFSSWAGQPCMWLEDLFIREAHRRSGMGGTLFSRLVELCRERHYASLMWTCRDWNTKAIDFYLKNGAVRKEGLGLYQLDAAALAAWPPR